MVIFIYNDRQYEVIGQLERNEVRSRRPELSLLKSTKPVKVSLDNLGKNE